MRREDTLFIELPITWRYGGDKGSALNHGLPETFGIEGTR